MTWRSRSLRVLPIAFPLLLPPDGSWARGRGHARGHHHDHHHPSRHHVFGFGHPCGYAPCGCGWSVGCGHTLAPGSPQSSAKKTPAARGPPAERPPTVESRSAERSMAQFIEVATTDELADEQAKLVEVEGQKIALFRVDGGFKCAGSWGARMRPVS